EVELALPEVWLCVPSAHVVVDGHARIPLSDLVQRAVASHTVGPVIRNRERVLKAEHERPAAGREGRVKADPHHRVVDPTGDAAAVDLKSGEVVPAAEAAHAPARLTVEQGCAL